MNKLKDEVRERMRKEALTDASVSVMMVVSRYQDNSGHAHGVHYDCIRKEAHISATSFYSSIRDLENRGFIKTIQNKEYGDWDIIILNNDFSYDGALAEGYIDTNHEIFYTDEFFNMTVIQKLLAMDLMRICQSNKELKGCYRIGVQNFYDKYQEEFQTYAKHEKLTKRALQDCLKILRSFFSIGIKNGLYWFRPLKEKVYQKESMNRRTEEGNLRKFIGAAICRRLKLSYTDETFKDTTDLIKQYGKICRQKNMNVIELLFKAAKNSLEKANEDKKKKKDWKRDLQPKLINKYINSEIYAYSF